MLYYVSIYLTITGSAREVYNSRCYQCKKNGILEAYSRGTSTKTRIET